MATNIGKICGNCLSCLQVGRFGFVTQVPVGVNHTSADTPHSPRLALQQLSKSLFPALVEGDPSVRKPRRLPRQLDDRLSQLAAIGERHQKKAFIAFLLNLDLGRGLRHGNETQLAMSGSSCKLALRPVDPSTITVSVGPSQLPSSRSS